MKLSIILSAVMAAASIFSKPLVEAIQLPKGCPANPFSLHLKSNNVSVFKSPIRFEGTSCGDEWTKFGLCCDQSDLKRYADQDQKDIMSAVGSLSAVLENFTRSYKTIHDLGNRIRWSELSRIPKARRSIIEFTKGETSANFVMSLRQLLAEDRLNASLERCWKKISHSRSNALCSVCSGRSDRFFSGGKILMLDSDCSSILQECAPAFSKTLRFLGLIEKFFDRMQASTEQHCHNLKKNLAYRKSLIRMIQLENAQTDIQEYLGLAGKQQMMAAAAGLCSKLLNIEGPTFIEKAESIIRSLNFTILESNLRVTHKQIIDQRSKQAAKSPFTVQVRNFAFGKLQRLHNAFDQQEIAFPQPSIFSSPATSPNRFEHLRLDSLMVGDVSIVAKKVDSSYTSYFGTTGTTVSTPTNRIPFNITREFP